MNTMNEQSGQMGERLGILTPIDGGFNLLFG